MVNVKSVNQVVFDIIRIACYERGIEIMFCCHYYVTSGSLTIAMKCLSAITLTDRAITLSLPPRPPVTCLTDPMGL